MNRVVFCLALLSACIKSTDDQTEAPPPAEPRSEAVYAAQPDEPKHDAVLASLSDEAAAYYADCSHRFQVQDEESEQLVDACLYTPFDQNCSPDPSGCWDAGQACITACGPTCETCDNACGGGCDSCKSKCKKDDGECVAECAEARVECHDKCMEAKSDCAETKCPAAERQCNDEHAALVKETCPKCEQIEACVNKAIENEHEPFEVCARKFKREPDECIEWCAGF